MDFLLLLGQRSEQKMYYKFFLSFNVEGPSDPGLMFSDWLYDINSFFVYNQFSVTFQAFQNTILDRSLESPDKSKKQMLNLKKNILNATFT